MTEEEQRELPASTLSKLASLQKNIPLEQRGMLWMRLNRIYAAWPAHKMHILRRDLLNTMRLVRDWFEQKEVPQKSVHFSQARSFCVHLGTYLRPYEDAKLVEELADLLHDYGSTDNIADFADDQGIKLFSYVKRPKDSDRSDVLCRIISKLASSLALRRRTRDAIILLGRAAPERILDLETGSSRDILLSLLAMELEEPESALEARNELEVCAKSHLGGTEASFGQLLATLDKKSKEMAEVRQRGQVDIVSLVGGDIAEVSLSYLKRQMRTLLLEPKINPDIPSTEVKRTKGVLFLYNAMEALFLYEQFLSKGFRADRELYRIARMARKRTGTHSNFSFDLREAAHLRVQELRRREVLNFKKRWMQPKPDIAGRWIEPRLRERTALGVHVEQGAAGTRDEAQSPAQLTSPETSEASTVIATSPAGSEIVDAGALDMRATAEATAVEEVTTSAEAMAITPVVAEVTQQSIPLDVPRENIYANATLGQVLRLAIEIGDNDLARAAFQAVREDPTFTWTLDDSDRVSSLLDLLIADASRTDLTWMAQQNAIQLACSFYTKWRGDVYLSTGPSVEQEDIPRARWRAPTFHILRLLASQEKAFGFVSTFKALISDPSVTLTAEHLERYLRVAVQHGALSWIGFKLHLTRETLRRGRHTSHLVKELDHALASTYSKRVSIYHRSYFRWCDAVLRQISRLGIAQDYHLFKDVVAVYNGTSIAEEGSSAQMIVATLKKENIAPASKQDTLYIEARMLSMSSDDLRLLKLIRAKELVQVAPDITGRVSELARNGNRLYASKLSKLFSAFAEEDEHAEAPEVVAAIQSMKEVFLQTRKEADQLSRRKVSDIEGSYSTSSNIAMDSPYRVPTAITAGRTGELLPPIGTQKNGG